MRSTAHRRAGYLAAVRSGLTHTAAAEAAGVDRSTSRRWRADPLFRLQLRDAQAAHHADVMATIAQRIAAAQQPEAPRDREPRTTRWTDAKRAAARARAAAYWTPARRAQAR